jgi:hypothetical protein
MRKRVMLFAAPLVLVAIATSVAVAAPSEAEHSPGRRLDKLHAVRPIAASTSTASSSPAKSALSPPDATAVLNYLKYRLITDYLRSTVGGDDVASPSGNDATLDVQAPAEDPPESTSVPSSSAPGDFLSCVRNRESGGNYGVYNEGGSGASGAYQFLPGTWNAIAEAAGRPDLVGVDPAQAAPSDQDAMAQALYSEQGSAPWGGGC